MRILWKFDEIGKSNETNNVNIKQLFHIRNKQLFHIQTQIQFLKKTFKIKQKIFL